MPACFSESENTPNIIILKCFLTSASLLPVLICFYELKNDNFLSAIIFFEKPSHFIYLPLHLKIHHGLQSISIINLLFSTLENFSDGNFLVNLLWKGIGAIL